ncbi:nucleoside 2-deoxyribosyltransferase domain-containing protein [Roseateles sp.]|uniref:nucleoside 2-deoxyribosyltransferase domain-containing protein n=1 Tax=Roseateles sp. TaxID=1971397 RepID=UPI0031CE504E
MNLKTTVYLAGGMKSHWQDRVIAAFPDVDFIDPRSHGLLDEKAYTEWDLNGVARSDLVLAYMDSANPSGFGLNLEVGFAKASGVPIWYVCEDTTQRQRYFGMVRACANRCFDSLDHAIEALEEIW